MDKNAITLGLQIGRILAGQRRKRPVTWYNMLSMSGEYDVSDYTPGPTLSGEEVAFDVGGCPLEWTKQIQYSEGWTDGLAHNGIRFVPGDLLARGYTIELDVTFPDVATTGYEGIRTNLVYHLGGNFIDCYVYYNWESESSGLVLQNISLFTDCNLTEKQDSQGNTIGFVLRGTLDGDVFNVYEDAWTTKFTNTEPFVGTITMKHGSHDDIRFRVIQ